MGARGTRELVDGMSEKLKPCPFCGGEGIVQAIDFYPDYSDPPIWWVACDICGAHTDEYEGDTEAEAVKAWNTRNEPITLMSPITTVSEGEPQTYVPLRTCRNIHGIDYGFKCSKCGSWYEIEYPCYCPECGAKVVE